MKTLKRLYHRLLGHIFVTITLNDGRIIDGYAVDFATSRDKPELIVDFANGDELHTSEAHDWTVTG